MEPVQTASPTTQFRWASLPQCSKEIFNHPASRHSTDHRQEWLFTQQGCAKVTFPPEYHISSTEKMTAPLTHDVRAKLRGA